MDSGERSQLLPVDLANVTAEDYGVENYYPECSAVVDRSLGLDSSPRSPVLDDEQGQGQAFAFKELDTSLLPTSLGNRAIRSDHSDFPKEPDLSNDARAPPTPTSVFNDPADSFYLNDLPGFSGGVDYCNSSIASHSCFKIPDIEGVKLPLSVSEPQLVQLLIKCVVPLERMTWNELELLLSVEELDAIIRGSTVQDTYVVCSLCATDVLDHLDGRLEHALLLHNEENMLFRFKCLQPNCELKTQDWEVLEQHLNSGHPRVPWKYRDTLSTKSEACSRIWKLHHLCFPDSKRTAHIKRPHMKNSRNYKPKPTARKSSCSMRMQQNCFSRRRRRPSTVLKNKKQSEKRSSTTDADADVAATRICALCGECVAANAEKDLESSRLEHVFVFHNREVGAEIFRFKSCCEFKAQTWKCLEAHFSAQHDDELMEFSDVMNETGHSDTPRILEVYTQCFPDNKKAQDATNSKRSSGKTRKTSFAKQKLPRVEKARLKVMPEPDVIILSSSSDEEDIGESISSLKPFCSSSSCWEVESQLCSSNSNHAGIPMSVASVTAAIEVEDLGQDEHSGAGSSRGNGVAEQERNFGMLESRRSEAEGPSFASGSKRKQGTIGDCKDLEEPILSKLSKFFAAGAIDDSIGSATATAKNEMDTTDFTAQCFFNIISSPSQLGLDLKFSAM